ncbi:calcium-binding protein [Neorhizobium tomejilense]|uniref:calcium-binding protein n=1 Tax=Neorhizobium tomejilense TaxID=2093828 RepID=UPI000CF8687F|nr:hypothetical protein [Neorhizobium tomejilense]
MLGALSSVNASYSGSSALLLLQSISASQTGSDGKSYTASAGLALTSNHTASAAVDLLIRIIMDAQGNSQVEIDAEGGTATAKTGDGDDTIEIRAGAAFGVYGGGDDDRINIVATGIQMSELPTTGHIYGGSGNDHIDIDSNGTVHGVYGEDGDDVIGITRTGNDPDSWGRFGIDIVNGGSGNDTMQLESSMNVGRIYGDRGDDLIDIKANGWADGIRGGDGNDSITAQAKDVSVLDGGAGDDTIVVNASHASYIDGGDGNDTIIVTTDSFLRNISGGKGDDHVVLDNRGRTEASYYFSAGDGRDVVATNGPLEISGFSEDGTQRLDMSKASITMDGDTVTIGFDGSSDSITVKLGGRMADAGNIHLVYKPETQSLLIADDRYIVENYPPQMVFNAPEGSHVGSFQR